MSNWCAEALRNLGRDRHVNDTVRLVPLAQRHIVVIISPVTDRCATTRGKTRVSDQSRMTVIELLLAHPQNIPLENCRLRYLQFYMYSCVCIMDKTLMQGTHKIVVKNKVATMLEIIFEIFALFCVETCNDSVTYTKYLPLFLHY